ncbi:MAG: hypothetical protein U0414_36845 [Polyangiaceae bacterium]
MASLMDVVMKSLPFAALDGALAASQPAGPGPALRRAAGSDLAGRLEFVPVGQSVSLSALRPPAQTYLEIAFEQAYEHAQHQEIWGFDHGPNPAEVTNVTCRVWGEGYDKFRVLEALRFGHEAFPSNGAAGAFEPVIKAVDTRGVAFDLPLSADFVRATWLVTDVTLPAGHPTWQLKTGVDKALVQVLVYELVGGSTTPTPLRGADAVEQAAFDEAAAAYAKVASGVTPDDVPAKLFADQTFFPDGLLERAGVGAATGEKAATSTVRNRIVVILSWTFCRAALDFAPGAAIPMGRVHPHAIVVSNASYRSFAASLQFDRPAATTNLDHPKECCKSGGKEMHAYMSSVLVTETNAGDAWMERPPLPIWSNLFSYYVCDPTRSKTANVLLQRMRMVRNDRPRTRSNNGFVVRTLGPLSTDVTTKLPRQGEFDNIHSAPPMQAPQVVYIGPSIEGEAMGFHGLEPVAKYPVIADSLKVINMAPFCAHDCFHLHWRWTDSFAKLGPAAGPQYSGWSGEASATRAGDAPYAVPGAPLVQPQQSVDLWYRSDHEFTYHAFMGNHVGSADYPGATVPAAMVDIPPGDVQYVCHHGAAYGLTADFWWGQLATTGAGMPGEAPGNRAALFYGSAGHVAPVLASASWALLYWRLRYVAQYDYTSGGYQLYERTTAVNLPGARDL